MGESVTERLARGDWDREGLREGEGVRAGEADHDALLVLDGEPLRRRRILGAALTFSMLRDDISSPPNHLHLLPVPVYLVQVTLIGTDGGADLQRGQVGKCGPSTAPINQCLAQNQGGGQGLSKKKSL